MAPAGCRQAHARSASRRCGLRFSKSATASIAAQAAVGLIWQLRQAVTPYGAAYVALAEVLNVVLVTADRRLARAPGLKCDVEILGNPGALR